MNKIVVKPLSEVKEAYQIARDSAELIHQADLSELMNAVNSMLSGVGECGSLTIHLSQVMDHCTNYHRAFSEMVEALRNADYTVEDVTGRGEKRVRISGWA